MPNSKPPPRGRSLLLALGIVLSGSPSPAAARVDFERHEIVTNTAERQTVLAAFLLGGAIAELAVLEIDESGERRLGIYAFGDGTWAPGLDAVLGSEVVFVDIASIGGRDRLLIYEPGRLGFFDPESVAKHALLAVDSSFRPPRRVEIPHVDVTHDVNGDGRDDLVLPAEGGFRIFVQTAEGGFAEAVEIGPPAELRRITGADGYRYDPWAVSRIHEVDYDLDGRPDLVFWNGDRFEAHLQGEGGLFAPEAVTFTAPVTFDSDDPSGLATGAMAGRVLDSLADLNGDGIADLVVHSLAGSAIAEKRSSWEIYLGARAPGGGTAFAREAGVAFRSEGKVFLGMDRLGLDPEGRITLMLTAIRLEHLESSLWKKLKGFMGDDVGLDLELYRTEGGRFRDRPEATFGIALDGVPSHREPGWVPLEIVLRGGTHEKRRTQEAWPRAFNRTLLVGDVTGDGRPDLLLEPEFRELHLHTGVPGPDLFARQPQRVPVLLHDGEYAWLADLDRDGRQDILVHHPFTERDPHGAPRHAPGTEPHRVTILLAR